ncbi:DUF6768 family protein [Muriicola sp.]|uniref:DUF6768 family protein n=1 Tax=Muriicola sp. TaxID=2020856 RepID=UPI003562FA5C
MKKEMEEIDKMIREALSDQEAQFYEDLNEPPVLQKLGEVYKSQLGWLALVMNVIMLFLAVLAVYSIISLWNASEMLAMIRWAVVSILSVMAIGILKLYFWMQMDKNDIRRELKRIELQIAALLHKLEQ